MPPRLLHAHSIALAAILAGVAGCGTAGSSSGLSSERYPLGEKGEAARRNAPAELPRELNKVWLTAYIVEPGDGHGGA